MVYVICNVETGELLQVSETSLSVSGYPLTIKTFDMPLPDLTRVEWDRGGLNFKVKSQDRIISKLAYLRKFTGEERVAVRTAAKSNVILEDYLALMELAEEVNLDDIDTITAVGMLEQVGLIGPGRSMEILS